MKWLYAFCLHLCFICVVALYPRVANAQDMITFNGKDGITKKLSALPAGITKKTLDSAAVRPLRSYFKRYNNFVTQRGTATGIPLPRKGGGDNGVLPPSANRTTQQASGTVADKIGSNFLGVDFYESPIGWPPDPSGDVGMNQIVVSSNNGIAIFDKPHNGQPPIITPTGYSKTLAPAKFFRSLEQFFSPVLPDSSFTSDPHVRYDRLSRRWFIVCIEVNATFENNAILLAVSSGENIADSSSFTYYRFNSSLFPYNHAAPYAPFLDYPTLGVDMNSLVIGGNQFGYDSLTNVGYLVDKQKLLNGHLVVHAYELGVANFTSGEVKGMVTPQGVHNDDPQCKLSFFVGENYYQNAILVTSIRYDILGRPHFLRQTDVAVGNFNNPRDNSSPGGLAPIDQLDTRLFAAAIHKNKLTGKSSLWTAHAIGVDQHGDFIGGSDSDFVATARTGSRWYEITDMYTRPLLSQMGTVQDDAQPSGRRAVQYFNPSIAANGQGRAVMGGTTDAWNEFLNVFVTARNYDDDYGTMQQPVKATNTTAMYAPYVTYRGAFYYINRWGDFSQTVVDPGDDQTIWTFQEYADVDDSYGIRVVEVKAPAPDLQLKNMVVSNEKDTTILLDAGNVSGASFFDPGNDEGGPGFKRLAAASTGGVAISNVKMISAKRISVALHTEGVAAGNYKLSVTNPDGQSATLAYSIVAGSNMIAEKTTNALPSAMMQQYINSSEVHPNPAKSQVTLSVTAAAGFAGKIEVADMNGKVIRNTALQFVKGGNNVSLSLSGLTKGAYIITVYNVGGQQVASHKIIKQ